MQGEDLPDAAHLDEEGGLAAGKHCGRRAGRWHGGLRTAQGRGGDPDPGGGERLADSGGHADRAGGVAVDADRLGRHLYLGAVHGQRAAGARPRQLGRDLGRVVQHGAGIGSRHEVPDEV